MQTATLCSSETLYINNIYNKQTAKTYLTGTSLPRNKILEITSAIGSHYIYIVYITTALVPARESWCIFILSSLSWTREYIYIVVCNCLSVVKQQYTRHASKYLQENENSKNIRFLWYRQRIQVIWCTIYALTGYTLDLQA